ncbi:hypothetical protein B738_24227 [Photorhabdus temperata subsp. temperata M1021]|nr:hypothetical protein B738_24227 [Photorhabdus temperata subsp. temperata M1021]
MTSDSGFVDKLRTGDHIGRPSISREQNASYAIADMTIPARSMQVDELLFLLFAEINSHTVRMILISGKIKHLY